MPTTPDSPDTHPSSLGESPKAPTPHVTPHVTPQATPTGGFGSDQHKQRKKAPRGPKGLSSAPSPTPLAGSPTVTPGDFGGSQHDKAEGGTHFCVTCAIGHASQVAELAEQAYFQVVQAALLEMDARTRAVILGHLVLTSMAGFDDVSAVCELELHNTSDVLEAAEKGESDPDLREALGTMREGVADFLAMAVSEAELDAFTGEDELPGADFDEDLEGGPGRN